MKNNNSLLPILLASLSLSAAVIAGPFPGGCVSDNYRFDNQYLFLNKFGQQTVFMLQNKANAPIYIERVQTKDAFMTPSFRVSLDSNAWGAFSSESQNLPFACYTVTDESKHYVNCEKYVQLCHYPHAVFAVNNKGNYWISSNKTRTDAIRDAVATGIYLKW